jgi:hypothetical protein
MIFLILSLIAIVAFLFWAARLDRKRRRRGNSGHNVSAAARAAKQDARQRSSEWGAGM